jgi:hypothetical protein
LRILIGGIKCNQSHHYLIDWFVKIHHFLNILVGHLPPLGTHWWKECFQIIDWFQQWNQSDPIWYWPVYWSRSTFWYQGLKNGGLDCPSNLIQGYWIGIVIQYPNTVGHLFIGYWIKTSTNTGYQAWIALFNLSSLKNWDWIREWANPNLLKKYWGLFGSNPGIRSVTLGGIKYNQIRHYLIDWFEKIQTFLKMLVIYLTPFGAHWCKKKFWDKWLVFNGGFSIFDTPYCCWFLMLDFCIWYTSFLSPTEPSYTAKKSCAPLCSWHAILQKCLCNITCQF